MNDPGEQRARLLAETFHEDWTNGPAADFAHRAAAHARRRRRVQQTAATAVATAVAAIAGILAWHPRVPAPSESAMLAAKQARAAVQSHGYEIISDAQLLAQLRDRPILVVNKKDGTREFVLLAE